MPLRRDPLHRNPVQLNRAHHPLSGRPAHDQPIRVMDDERRGNQGKQLRRGYGLRKLLLKNTHHTRQ